MKPFDFIEYLYRSPRPGAGRLTIWSGATKESAHVPMDDLAAVDDIAKRLTTAKHDTYFGLALRRSGLPSMIRGAKADCVALPCFWLDLDLATAGHAAKNLPDLDAAAAILETCSHPPSAMVHSGGGLHVYWVFDKLWLLAPEDVRRADEVCKAFQRPLIAAAEKLGYHVDETGDITRVLRLPGTMNWKVKDNPRPATVMFADPVFYDPHALVNISIVTSAPTKSSTPAQAKPQAPMDPDALLAAVKLKLQRLSNRDNRRLLALVLDGKPFAKSGERDHMLQRVASVIAFVAPTGADAGILAELIEPSLLAMAAEENDPANPCPTWDKAAEKIERAMLDAASSRERDREMREALTKNSRPPGDQSDGEGHASSDGGSPGGAGTDQYTEEDLDRFADLQDCTADEFRRRWIIQHDTAFYVFAKGEYVYPVSRAALLTRLRDDLAAAESLGVFLWVPKANGEGVRPRTVQEIMDTYGTVARQARGSLTIGVSRFDPETAIFWEAFCPPRKIAPVYDEKVDTWLRLLGGADADKLLDWLATVRFLERQTSALYLSGKPNAGKTMFANGISRIWSQAGHTALSDVVGSNFNSGIAKCPIIFGDEAMECSTVDLRRLVGSSVHTLKRKFLPNVELDGCLRVILADNSGKMLVQGDELGGDDLEAVASKFLHIKVGQEPVEYLKSLGGRNGTNDWVDGDRIAAHVLWLENTREVSPGSRFLVEGSLNDATRTLATQHRGTSVVCEWIVGYLNKPLPNILQTHTVVVGGGKILVNVEGPYQFWTDYVKSEKQQLSRTRIGAALKNLATGVQRIDNMRYHDIQTDLIYAWIEQNLVGDVEAVRRRVEGPLPPTLKVMDGGLTSVK